MRKFIKIRGDAQFAVDAEEILYVRIEAIDSTKPLPRYHIHLKLRNGDDFYGLDSFAGEAQKELNSIIQELGEVVDLDI